MKGEEGNMVESLQRNWWMLALRGVLAIVFGILVIVWPGMALSSLILLVGAYFFVDGVFSIITSVRDWSSNRNGWLGILEGVLGVLAGIATFVWPGLTAIVLLYLIAFWAVVTGVLEIMAAWRLRQEIEGEIWLALAGILSIAFGAMMFLFPGAGALAVLGFISGYAILFGITLILLAFRLRNHDSAQPLRTAS
jgi:uncharacterized membrane protein HdeD (DUF308 family)